METKEKINEYLIKYYENIKEIRDKETDEDRRNIYYGQLVSIETIKNKLNSGEFDETINKPKSDKQNNSN